MKINTFLSMAALAGVAAVAVFASCSRQKEIEAPPQDELPVTGVHTVVFNALQGSTRAQFGELENGQWPTLWTDNDSELKLSLNYGGAQTAAVSPSEDYRSATFSAEIDFTGTASPYTYYAISPSSAAKALSPSREAWKISIPCVQTPSAGSVDEAAIIIAASSASFNGSQAVGNVDLQFEHLTAYGRISLENLTLTDETLQAVELTTSSAPFVGDWYWKCDASSEGHELIDYGASSTLTINTTRCNDIWFGVAPVDMSNQIVVVRALTDKGVFEKMIEFPDGKKFEAGQCAVFSVDMSVDTDYTAYGSGSGGGSGAFTLVTDASTLAAGDEVLIVYTTGTLALGALNSSGNFRDPVEVTISNNAIASAGSATILTLETGSTNGTWAFKDGDYYLASAATGNYLKNSSSKNSNASWAISIDSNGLASVVAQAGASTILSYNTGSPRFSCYGNNNQKQVSIYRRSASSGGLTAADPMLEKTNYGCWLGTDLEREYNPGTDQVTRSYDENHKLTYTMINPSTVEEIEIGGYARGLVKGDPCLVTVRWRRGRTTVCSGSYPMSVIKEDGPKVWLSDGTGKGVIIKK